MAAATRASKVMLVVVSNGLDAYAQGAHIALLSRTEDLTTFHFASCFTSGFC